MKIEVIRPNESLMLESTVFEDNTNNAWRVERYPNSIFLFYLGSEQHRYAEFTLLSYEGATLTSKHDNMFSFDTGGFDTYCWIRDLIIKNETLFIWVKLQKDILYYPIGKTEQKTNI